MNPIRFSISRPLAVVFLFALPFAAPRLHAQAQSLLSSNQVVISRVENVNPTTILISGINFEKFKGAPVVSLSGAGTAVIVIPSSYDAQAKDITATLPANVAAIPGSYRLMVSFGSGTAGTDVFEFTVGAVGPKGAKGDKGDKGDKGEKGDQGLRGEKGDTGLKGDKGDRGEKGETGLKGDKGETGAQGIQGEKGLTGEQGPRGDKGEKGETGAQGVQGEKGLTGEQGPKGDKGEKGDQGVAGEKGATGATGPMGPAGASSHFPLYHNVDDARNAGVKIGEVWVQDSSGQVFQMVK